MTSIPRRELLERQRRLQAVYPVVQRELMRIPGVVKVGIGIKETGGVLTGATVFRVYVVEKREADEVTPTELIPREIEGFETDVIVVRPDHPEDDNSKYRPLKGGILIERDDADLIGTLGCFAHLVSDNSVVLLSNHHILYGKTGKDGTEIGQPDYTSSLCCTCGDVAINVHGIKRNHMDCAIARLKPEVAHNPRIAEIGFITGVNDAIAGESVKKRGKTTLLTTGTVTNLTMDAGGTKILEIEVKKNNGQERFSRAGDSGAALLNNDNEIIGLHKAGNNRDNVTPGNFFSTSIGIQEVLDALQADGFQITIITGENDDEAGDRAPATAGLTDALWAIEQRLAESEAGRQLRDALRLHQKEIVRLVNDERPVTVTWHRKKGPVFLAALGRSAKESSYRIPAEFEGITRQHAAIAILAVLEAHGTAALRADLGHFSGPLSEAFARGDTIEEMICAWEEAVIAMAAELPA